MNRVFSKIIYNCNSKITILEDRGNEIVVLAGVLFFYDTTDYKREYKFRIGFDGKNVIISDEMFDVSLFSKNTIGRKTFGFIVGEEYLLHLEQISDKIDIMFEKYSVNKEEQIKKEESINDNLYKRLVSVNGQIQFVKENGDVKKLTNPKR